jgi:hypothetical protein
MANIGTLAVSVVANTQKFQKGIAGAKSQWAGFIKGFVSVAAVTGAVVGLTRAVSATAAQIDQLAKSGRALGITYQEMRRLSIMARMTGLDVNSLNTAFRTLATQLMQADQGGRQATAAFDRLGLSAQKLKSQAMPQSLQQVSMALAKIEDPAERIALASQLFGRNGAAIAGAASGLADAAAAADRVNDKLSEDQVKALEKANDAWVEYGESVSMTWNKIVAATATGQKKVADMMSVGTRVIGDVLISEAKGWRGLFDDVLQNPMAGGLAMIRRRFGMEKSISDSVGKEAMRQAKGTEFFKRLFPNADKGMTESATQSGTEYADAFAAALDRSEAFTMAMREKAKDAMEQAIDEIDERLDFVKGAKDEKDKPKDAGVIAKTSGFDIRGLMMGSANTVDDKQLTQLEKQTQYLENIKSNLTRQVAMVGA